MADFTIDTSEVDKLALDLAAVPAKVIPQAERVMKKGAQNIKEAQQEAFRGSPYFKGVARDVSYDRRGLFGSIGYEVGPAVGRGKGHGGGLGGIAVEGGARGGGGTVDIDHTLADEVPNVVSELTKAVTKALP